MHATPSSNNLTRSPSLFYVCIQVVLTVGEGKFYSNGLNLQWIKDNVEIRPQEVAALLTSGFQGKFPLLTHLTRRARLLSRPRAQRAGGKGVGVPAANGGVH